MLRHFFDVKNNNDNNNGNIHSTFGNSKRFTKYTKVWSTFKKNRKKKKQHNERKINDIIIHTKKACYQKHSEMHARAHKHTRTCAHSYRIIERGEGVADELKQELLLIKRLCEKKSFQTSFEEG